MPNSLSNQTVENVVQVESISSDLGGVKVGLVTEFSSCMASQNCLPPQAINLFCISFTEYYQTSDILMF